MCSANADIHRASTPGNELHSVSTRAMASWRSVIISTSRPPRLDPKLRRRAGGQHPRSRPCLRTDLKNRHFRICRHISGMHSPTAITQASKAPSSPRLLRRWCLKLYGTPNSTYHGPHQIVPLARTSISISPSESTSYYLYFPDLSVVINGSAMYKNPSDYEMTSYSNIFHTTCRLSSQSTQMMTSQWLHTTIDRHA